MPGDAHPAETLEFLEAIAPSREHDLWFAQHEHEGDEPADIDRRIYQQSIPRARGGRHITYLNSRLFGIFVAPNHIRFGRLRRIEDTEQVTCIWVDLDRTPLPDTWALTPHAITQTSHTPDYAKHHAIWRVDGLPQDQATFQRLFVPFAVHHGADTNAGGINRVLRVPGYDHHKRDTVRSSLVSAHPGRAYTLDEVLEAWPILSDAMQTPAADAATTGATPTAIKGNLTGYTRAALDAELSEIERAGDDQRNETITRCAFKLGTLVGAGLLDEDAVIELVVGAYEHSGGQKPTRARKWATRQVKKGAQNPRNLAGVRS